MTQGKVMKGKVENRVIVGDGGNVAQDGVEGRVGRGWGWPLGVTSPQEIVQGVFFSLDSVRGL